MNLRISLLTLLVLCSSVSFSKSLKLKTGVWYTSIQLTEEHNLPVLIDLKKDKKTTQLSVINGSERILLNNVERSGDSIFVSFPAFDSELRAKVHSKKFISGRWYNHAKKGNYYLPFWSKHELANKYPIQDATIDVNGRWEVTFAYEDDPEKSIGLFNSDVKEGINGNALTNRITGTFLTETGDYRFLEGATIGDSLFLSTFDGSHAFLFTALLKDDTLWGEFLSGKHYKTKWWAVKNDLFELGHPDSLTYVTNDTEIEFSLPDLSGNMYHYPNDQTKNKVHLIQIMGTWCPNCLDESIFLKEVYQQYEGELEIVAVTFETQKELIDKINKVQSYRVSLDLPYSFVIGGDACKPCATNLFPMLSDILSFPTLIFIDKKGEIRKVHTGFNGPGTGEYYTQFVTGTKEYIEKLIKE